jgi:hypothetical protein
MNARVTVITLLVVLLAANSVRAELAGNQSDVWRNFAERLETGAFVTVRLKNGSRIKGHLIQVSPDGLQVKPKTRISVPIRMVPLDAIESIERERQGMSPGAKVAIGAGVGMASILILVFLAILSSD